MATMKVNNNNEVQMEGSNRLRSVLWILFGFSVLYAGLSLCEDWIQFGVYAPIVQDFKNYNHTDCRIKHVERQIQYYSVRSLYQVEYRTHEGKVLAGWAVDNPKDQGWTISDRTHLAERKYYVQKVTREVDRGRLSNAVYCHSSSNLEPEQVLSCYFHQKDPSNHLYLSYPIEYYQEQAGRAFWGAGRNIVYFTLGLFVLADKLWAFQCTLKDFKADSEGCSEGSSEEEVMVGTPDSPTSHNN